MPEYKKVVPLQSASLKKRGWNEANGSKFFESLRPAQDQRHWEAARGKEPFRRDTNLENIEAEPEIQSRTISKDNSTTKSLILAQDER